MLVYLDFTAELGEEGNKQNAHNVRCRLPKWIAATSLVWFSGDLCKN
jgi:hypothetical protein